LFQDHIFARGEVYYYESAVQDLEKIEHGYHRGHGGLRGKYRMGKISTEDAAVERCGGHACKIAKCKVKKATEWIYL
jgi:hypothetical protein